MLPVYVLSLPGCEARRAPLLQNLRDLRFEPEVVLGIDGRAGLPCKYEPQIDRVTANRRARRSLTDGEFACALSHQAVYARLLEDGHDRAIVFEDDAIIDRSLLPVLHDLKDHDFDLALLDHDLARAQRRSRRRLPSGSILWRVANIPDLNTGYILSAAGAAKIAALSFPITYNADWPCDVAQLRTYAVMPRAVGRPRSKDASLLHSARQKSQRSARWGNPTPPHSRTDFAARLSRFLARRLF